MHKNRQLVVFARAPRLGNGKTRLAQDIGAEAAYVFYEACLSQLLRQCSKGPWQFVVAVASDEDRDHPLFYNQALITQIKGNLGLRMKEVLANNHEYHTLIVGSDIPELKPSHVISAFEALDTHDFVIGPATDGGFWSIGCRQQLVLPEAFMQNVRWSSRYALQDTLSSIPNKLTVAQIQTLSDIDDSTDYHKIL